MIRSSTQLVLLSAFAVCLCPGEIFPVQAEGGTSSWDGVPPGLHSGFGSVDSMDDRESPPEGMLPPSIELQAWRGERVYCKLLVWSAEPAGAVRIRAQALCGNDRKIDVEDISVSTVGYVLTDQFLNERGTPCGPRDNARIPSRPVPDVLTGRNEFTLDSRGTQPVWISIDVPSDAPAGDYSGSVRVDCGDRVTDHAVRLQVLNHRLPPPEAWRFHLDLWQNPFAVARYHQVEPWSEKHWRLLRPYLEMLARAGQKCVTATLIDLPWGDSKPCFDDHRSMIRWTKRKDGSWAYDYSVFDRYVRLAMDCGITKQINGYSMLPLNGKFTWFDETNGETVIRELMPGSPEYEAHWTPFLLDFRDHLKKVGWLDKTMIGLDERGEEEMAGVIRFLHRVVPDIRIASAGFYHKSICASIHDYSSNWRDWGRIPFERIAERKALGLTTTYYVACGIPKPNNFTFSPPAESCFEGWMAAAMGFDGFLRWAYNSWPEQPLTDSRYIKWPAGDTYFIYPGPLSSIRFERLREGIQDYEKIGILRERLDQDASPAAAVLRRELGDYLATIRPGILDKRSAAEVVREGKRLIDRIAGEFDKPAGAGGR